MSALRSLLFALVQIVTVPPFALLALLTFPLKPHARYRIITLWSRLIVWTAERVCGVRYRVIGTERIPPPPFIILSNHQSAWETLAFQVVFPPQVWVVKRELQTLVNDASTLWFLTAVPVSKPAHGLLALLPVRSSPSSIE